MKKLFLLFAAMMTATVMNLHADTANLDLTSGHTTSGQSSVTYTLDANISIVIACSKAKISNDGYWGTSFSPAGTITVKAAEGCTITAVNMEFEPMHCPSWSTCGFLPGSSTPGISNSSQYSSYSGSATQVVWTFNNMEDDCTLSKASVTYTKSDMDTLYLNTGGNTLWNQAGAKFSVFYWNDGEAGKFTDFLELAYGETDIYRAIIPKKDSVIFVRHAATADVPTWDNKLHQTKSDEVDLEIGNIMVITGWEPADREWDYYTPKKGPDTLDYLHFVSLKDNGTVRLNKLTLDASSLSKLTATFEYSTNRSDWNEYTWSAYDESTYMAAGKAVTLNKGDTVFFRAKGTNGKNTTMSYDISGNNFKFIFGTNDSIAAGGNIMSLYDASCTQETMTECGFKGLFNNAKQLVTAPKLPATTLAKNCYRQMFYCCSSLIQTPDLKATTLADRAYYMMFKNCSKLQVTTYNGTCSGAELVTPETTSATDWNKEMFSGCHGNAANNIQLNGHYCIKEYSYDGRNMLHLVGVNGGDTIVLNKVGANYDQITAKIQYSYNREDWQEYTWNEKNGDTLVIANAGDTVFFRAGGADNLNATLSQMYGYLQFAFGTDDSIAAGGNLMSLYDATLTQVAMTDYGFAHLFQNSYQLIAVPQLPATQLAEACYFELFKGCSKLQAAPTLPAQTMAKGCYKSLLQDCQNLTTTSTLPALQLEQSCYELMYSNTAITTAPQLLATEMKKSCYSQMFSGCINLVNAPSLAPATLASGCFYEMFNGCTALEVDTCDGTCAAAKLVVPATGAINWNKNMVLGCQLFVDDILLGGTYCFTKYEGAHDMVYTITPLDTIYTGSSQVPEVVMTKPYKNYILQYSYDGGSTWSSASESPFTSPVDTAVNIRIKCDKYPYKTVSAKNIALKISPRQVIFTSGSTTRDFDTTPLTNSTITITGDDFATNEGVDAYQVTGSQTNAGTSKNLFTYTLKSNTNPINYVFDTIYGNLTVNTLSDVAIDVMVDTLSKMYDGQPLSATYQSTAQLPADFTLAVEFDKPERTDAGKDTVEVTSVKVMKDGTDWTGGFILGTNTRGFLTIDKRDLTLTSATGDKYFDNDPLELRTITVGGNGFAGQESYSATWANSPYKVGTYENTFEYTLTNGAKAENYDITVVYGTLTIKNPIFPSAVGMYEKWNIVLNVNQLMEDFFKLTFVPQLLPEHVTWYKVVGTMDELNQYTGELNDDEEATPANGYYHTEAKTMDGLYYAVIYVPDVEEPMGIAYFQTNAVFMDSKRAPAGIQEMLNEQDNLQKMIINGQLVIVKDGKMFNAQGQAL